jgi:integrase
VRWVAEQLGHSSPMLTLKTYAHAIREEEMDLSFADFEVRDGSERLRVHRRKVNMKTPPT